MNLKEKEAFSSMYQALKALEEAANRVPGDLNGGYVLGVVIPAIDAADKLTCPNCGEGKHGVDSLCLDCWSEYLGTHVGGR